MKKLIGEFLVGLLICIAAIFLAFIQINELYAGRKGYPLLLYIAVPLFILGLLMLIHADKSQEATVEKEFLPQEVLHHKKKLSLIEKNTMLLSLWRKTQEQKDRIHMLQLSSQDNEKK